MSSATIRAKIQAGLANAVKAVGSAGAEKVYLITKVNTGGNDPLSPPEYTETPTLLLNAIFKSYDISVVGGGIVAGDRELISDHTVEIKPGSIIRQGTVDYIVVPSSPVAPTSDVLLYKSQCRVK